MPHSFEKPSEQLAIIRVGIEITEGNRVAVNELRDLCKTLASGGAKHIVLDFSLVHRCPSIVFGNVLVLAKNQAEAGGKIVLAAASEQVAKIARITGLTHTVTLYPSVAAATTALTDGGAK